MDCEVENVKLVDKPTTCITRKEMQQLVFDSRFEKFAQCNCSA